MLCLLHLLPLLLLSGVFAEKVLRPVTQSATRGRTAIVRCYQEDRFLDIVRVTLGPCSNPNLTVITEDQSWLNDEYPSRYDTSMGFAFRIRIVECSDAGEYCCKLTADPEGDMTKKIFLKVAGCTEAELADEFFGRESTLDYI